MLLSSSRNPLLKISPSGSNGNWCASDGPVGLRCTMHLGHAGDHFAHARVDAEYARARWTRDGHMVAQGSFDMATGFY